MSMDLIPVTNRPQFINKGLEKATLAIMSCDRDIRSRNFAVAAILAEVDVKGLYKEDGFSTTADYAQDTFSIKKTKAYALISIGKEYTRPILDKVGRTIGYCSNLLPPADPEKQDAPIIDFTTSQLERLIRLDRETVVSLINEGTIKPTMTVAAIMETIAPMIESKRKEKQITTEFAEPSEPSEPSEPAEPAETPRKLDVVRGDGFDQMSTDILIAELRARGYKVIDPNGKESVIDW